MFESVARELLQGGFICEYSKPDEWKALKDDDFRRRLNDWLRQVDMVLLSTTSGAVNRNTSLTRGGYYGTLPFVVLDINKGEEIEPNQTTISTEQVRTP